MIGIPFDLATSTSAKICVLAEAFTASVNTSASQKTV